MKLKLTTGGEIQVSDDVFGCKFNESLVHQVVDAFLAGARSGSKAGKSRAQVRGGGSKPWRQKGTGRARAGTSNSPIWRGGGQTFANTPRNFAQKVNRKMYRSALCSILSDLNRQNRLVIVDKIDLKEAKTKLLVEQLKALALDSVLVIDVELSENLILSGRNLPRVGMLAIHELDPVSALRFDKLLLTSAAIEKLGERLQ